MIFLPIPWRYWKVIPLIPRMKHTKPGKMIRVSVWRIIWTTLPVRTGSIFPRSQPPENIWILKRSIRLLPPISLITWKQIQAFQSFCINICFRKTPSVEKICVLFSMNRAFFPKKTSCIRQWPPVVLMPTPSCIARSQILRSHRPSLRWLRALHLRWSQILQPEMFSHVFPIRDMIIIVWPTIWILIIMQSFPQIFPARSSTRQHSRRRLQDLP